MANLLSSRPLSRIYEQLMAAFSTAGQVMLRKFIKKTEPSVLVFGNAPQWDPKAPITIGAFVFAGQDQIDFTGPFEVLSRIPNSRFVVLGKTLESVRDVKGLLLTPEVTIAEAPDLDILVVPGGLGQQNIMDDAEIISLIRRHATSGRLIFSVCTGALLCGAAGILRGLHATTHWAAKELLPFYGAIPTEARVVVDGTYVSAAGVTAGIDGALEIASLLRGPELAKQIQLEIEYAPNPHFHSGTPDLASRSVIEAFYRSYGENRITRMSEAERFAQRLAIKSV